MVKKDRNQHNICNCIESINIGIYEICLNGCIYCYSIKGNYLTTEDNHKHHYPDLPLMIGTVEDDSVTKDREIKSLKTDHLRLF